MARHILTPQEKEATQFSGDRAVEMAKRSHEKRKNNRSFSQLAQQISVNPAPSVALSSLEKLGIEDDEATCNALVVAGVYNRAIKGHPEAVEKWESWVNQQKADSDSDVAEAVSTAFRNYYGNIGNAFDDLTAKAMKHAFTHFNVSGGRGSLKSSFVSLIVPMLIMTHPLTHALVLRKVGNTIRDSVYSQYLWAIGQLGVSDYWEARKTSMELIFKPTGQKIMFRGADDPMKIKSVKAPFGYIAVTHFEELDQFAGRKEIRTILQSTMRGGELYWNFESYNPPISRDSWANKDALEVRDDRVIHKSTYLDVQCHEWLGDQFFAEAEFLKETNERAYQHEYLGIPTGTGGNVFENLEIREITDEEIDTMNTFYRGIDWGYFPDPFHYSMVSYDPARLTLYILDEYRAHKTSNREAYKALVDSDRLHTYDEVIADSAEPKSIADFNDFGAVCVRPAQKGAGSVEYSIKWLQSLKKIVIDPKRAPHSAEEFTAYEYNMTKDGEIINGYPDANNHAIDSVRYATERVWRRKGQ